MSYLRVSKLHSPVLANLRDGTKFKTVNQSVDIGSRCLTNVCKDYQYIEKSELPTFKFQKSLPRLGIPYVAKSIERYLESLQPIIANEEQYKRTVQIANAFKDSPEAKALQDKLIAQDKQNKHTSYISKPWFDMYLSSRLPLLLNYNPFMAWRDDPDPAFNSVTIRASNMLISAMRFRRSLVDQVLAPEVFHMNPAKSDTPRYRTVTKLAPGFMAAYVSMAFGAYPLDMSQFHNLFNSTRIPKKGKDELKTYPKSKHVAVLKGGQFFSFDVLDSNGDIRDAPSILANIKHLVNLPVAENQDSIAVLSSEDRDVWAAAREQLISSSSDNARNLEIVDSAQFVICLDDISFNQDTELLDGAANYLHGNSTKQGRKPLNRWFDKSFSIIFDSAGHASITFEHSWGDGIAVLRAFNDIYVDSCKAHFVGPDSKPSPQVDPTKEVQHLPFKLNDGLKNTVKAAETKWRSSTNALDLNYTKYNRMNREYFKVSKVSPDSMFQLAFQMAFYKVYKSTVPTYESCSTSAFKQGRTEVVRSCTRATKETCEAFAQRNLYSDKELRVLLDGCSKKHFQLTKEAAMGQGFDRHLFALRLQAEKDGNVPELFKDPSYAEANHYVLSTSTLYGEYFSGGGFAPVVEDGFGLGYGYVDDTLGIFCSAFKGKRDGKQLVQAFSDSLDEIRSVLENTRPEKGEK